MFVQELKVSIDISFIRSNAPIIIFLGLLLMFDKRNFVSQVDVLVN